MSQFSGAQGKGAMKRRRQQKRVQADERRAYGAVAIARYAANGDDAKATTLLREGFGQ